MTEVIKLTIEDVQDNVSEGIYDTHGGELKKLVAENHVFDEDKSVKWNREKVVSENEKIKDYNEKVKNNKFKGMTGFETDLTEAVANELNMNIEQAGVIFRQSWEEGHSSGYSEVIYYAMDMVSLFKRVKELGNV